MAGIDAFAAVAAELSASNGDATADGEDPVDALLHNELSE